MKSIISAAGYKILSKQNIFYLAISLTVVSSLYSCKSNSTTQAVKIQVNDTLAASRDSLQAQLVQVRYYLDESMNKVAMLDTELKQKDIQIAKLNNDIKHYKRRSNTFAAELRNARKTLASLKENAKGFEEHIALLGKDRDQAIADKNDLQAKYDELKRLGSVLHASNIRIAAIHIRHSGKEKKTARARRVNMFRMHFDIDENRIAEDGTKKLYIAIKAPNGNMMESRAIGSGTTTLFNGQSVSYSLEKEIALKQNEAVKDVSVDWKQEGKYEKGKYQVEIYNSGYPIGEGTVALR